MNRAYSIIVSIFFLFLSFAALAQNFEGEIKGEKPEGKEFEGKELEGKELEGEVLEEETSSLPDSPSSSSSSFLDVHHEYGPHLGLGFFSLNYKPIIGKYSPSAGFDLGFDYTLSFNSHWGISTGVGVSYSAGTYTLDSLGGDFAEVNQFGKFDRYTLEKYRETQQTLLLIIPLMARFETGMFYAALGGKVGLPISTTYNSKIQSLHTELHYYVNNKDGYTDTPLDIFPHHGYGMYNKQNNNIVATKGSITFEPFFFGSAEAGVIWSLTDKLSLTTGVYFDYCLLHTAIPMEEKKLFIDYQDIIDARVAAMGRGEDVSRNSEFRPAYKPASILASTFVDDKRVEKEFVEKVSPFSVGLKIGLVFGRRNVITKKGEGDTDLKDAAGATSAASDEERRLLDEELEFLRQKIGEMRQEIDEEERRAKAAKKTPPKTPQKTAPKKEEEQQAVLDDERKDANIVSIDRFGGLDKSASYYIVAGSFADKKSATRSLEGFVKEGFVSAGVMSDLKTTKYRVVLMSFSTREEAHRKLAEIKRRKPIYKDFWVLEQ
ncbi:hypothetical protein FACS1894199_07880 [Bacteroidia bacterium]|nr:hypothetical protein FACS1894199_07880 [Bacteroidia bacterium]